MNRFLALLFIIAWALPSAADESSDWPGVGRLDFGGRGFCTATLIAPNLVLTAAHCLVDPASGQPIARQDIQFLAGWRAGQAGAYRSIRRMVQHPAYAPDSANRAGADLALLELLHPVDADQIAPLPVATPPGPGARVSVISYSQMQSELPQVQKDCRVLSRAEGVITTSCTVAFGASGAPVIVEVNGAPHIVSLISAKAKLGKTPVSIGPQLQSGLRPLIEALRRAAFSDMINRMKP